MLFELAQTSTWYAYWLGVAVGVVGTVALAYVFARMSK